MGNLLDAELRIAGGPRPLVPIQIASTSSWLKLSSTVMTMFLCYFSFSLVRYALCKILVKDSTLSLVAACSFRLGLCHLKKAMRQPHFFTTVSTTNLNLLFKY